MDPRDDAFLNLATNDESLRRRYRSVIDARLGEGWLVGRKAGYLLIAAVGLIGFAAVGPLAWTEPESTPAPVRALLGLLAFVSLGWTVFACWALSRSRGGFADERLLASRVALGLATAALVGLGLTATAMQKESEALPVLMIALALVVIAAAGMVSARVDQSDLAIREQLLRLEARIVESQDRGRS